MKDLSKPIERIEHTVTASESGGRLDHVLADWVTWRSRADLQKRVKAGTVVVNGKPAKPRTKVFDGDLITVFVENDGDVSVDVNQIPLNILHEEETFVVLDKPSGVVMHPVGKHVYDTLMNVLHAHYRRDDPAFDVTPMVVHRLDQDTSGVLLVAKQEEARKRLGAAFEGREVSKEYLAIVHGRVEKDAFSVNESIGLDPRGLNKTMMACIPTGRSSLTDFKVEKRFANATLVRCFPKTGRQHQIRVHLAHVGHPILGDSQYGSKSEITAGDLGLGGDPDRVVLDRQALHASRLVVPHPVTGEQVGFDAPLAPDLATLCAELDA